ncbi:MAG: glycoside hydrolase, partial [Planctomycetota bacterium]
PCLVTDVGASADVVGSTGQVVPARDVETFARGILEMAALGEEERRALGLAAERRIRERFSVEAMADRTEEVLLSVVGQESSR